MGDAVTLRVIREPSRESTTLGSLYVDGVWQCWTLEDQVRAEKVPGQTAIPAGAYDVRLTPSPRFRRTLPEVLAVPGFQGIRIHAGNRASDTQGCILVGRERGAVWIAQSRQALQQLLDKLVVADTIRLKIYNHDEV